MAAKFLLVRPVITKGLSKKLHLVIVVMSLVLSTAVTSRAKPSQIEISTAQKRIEYGAPVVLTLRLVYREPQMWRVTGEIRQVVSLDSLDLHVQQSETEETRLFRLGKTVFYLQGTKGLEYIGKVVLWCHVHEERENLIKRMIFDKPGTYILSVMDSKKRSSNTLDILMKPSVLGRKALSILKDPNDIAFLLGGVYKSPEGISHLEEVVNQCEGTLLAKWCAARLGLVYFEDFHKKHPSFIKFKAKLKKGQVEEPLFDKAHMYLTAGAKLPDQFPIREKILYQLGRTEVIKDNYQKAFSLLDELGAKYPKGEYGKRASRAKQELQRIKKREENQ